MVRARIEVGADHFGYLVGTALRDHRVDQPVRAAIRDVVLHEAEVEQVLRVVTKAEVEPRVVAGHGLGARLVRIDDARNLGGHELA